MKKFFSLIAVALLTAVSVFANPLDYIESGSYAYYYDGRGGLENEYVRGYLVFHAEGGLSIVLMNVVNVKTRKSYKFNIGIREAQNKDIELVSAKGIEEIPEELRPEITQSIPDLLNFDAMYRGNIKKIDYDSTLEDKWEEYSLYYHYSKVNPMFKFDSISFNDPKDNIVFVTEKYGYVTINELDDFYSNAPKALFKKKERPSKNVIPEAAEQVVTLNGVEIKVDGNWDANDFQEGEIHNTGMWLKIDSIRDAQVMIERVPKEFPFKTVKEKEKFITSILLGIPNLIPYTVEVKKDGKDIVLTYVNYDEHNWTTINIVRLTKDTVINFSAFEDMYFENKDYFDNILAGIKVK